MKTITEERYRLLERLLRNMEEDAARHYPPMVDKVCEARTALWAFTQPVVPVLGEVS